MAQLIIERRDRSARPIHIQRDEVIEVLPDGLALGVVTQANIAAGRWLLVNVKNATVSSLATLKTPLLDVDGSVIAKRRARLDTAALNALPRWPNNLSSKDITDATVVK